MYVLVPFCQKSAVECTGNDPTHCQKLPRIFLSTLSKAWLRTLQRTLPDRYFGQMPSFRVRITAPHFTLFCYSSHKYLLLISPVQVQNPIQSHWTVPRKRNAGPNRVHCLAYRSHLSELSFPHCYNFCDFSACNVVCFSSL